MLHTIKKFTLISTMFLSSLLAGIPFEFEGKDFLPEAQKIYVPEEEIHSEYDRFHIHLGNNVWVETNALHRDKMGLFTFNSEIDSFLTDSLNVEYVKKWRCPYCNQYWPYGSGCKNVDCPSRFK